MNDSNQQSTLYSFYTLLAGALLGLMVFFNGALAKYVDPIFASLIIHIIGLITSIVILILKRRKLLILLRKHSIHWSYCVGVFGAIAVAIVGYTVNSKIGVAGTIGTLILGQVLYSWINDSFGLFGTRKRRLNFLDFTQALMILAGVAVIIYG